MKKQMNLFKYHGKNRPEIEYSFISSSHFIYLMLSIFLIIFMLPEKSLAQYGSISGYVYKYSNNAALSGVTVKAFDEDDKVRGSDDTDSKGKYEITKLPAGYYRICTEKNGYVSECYQQPESSGPNQCSGKDCGYFWSSDPNKMQGNFIEVVAGQQITNKKFYLARGGNIEGNISGANDNYSYWVVLDGIIQYKNNTPISDGFRLIKEGDHFTNAASIPPGTYTLRAEDTSPTYQYYCKVYYDGKTGTYLQSNAKSFTYQIDQSIKYTANFTIQRGGFIYGRVMERFYGRYVGIPEAEVKVKEKTFGFDKRTQTNEIHVDPNGVVHKGLFIIAGLPPGTYILKTDDSCILDPNLRLYLPEYYNNVYFEDQATPITMTEAQINSPNYEGTYIEIILQHSPVITGWVMEHAPSSCTSNVYDSDKALEDITIEISPNFLGEPSYAQTGPDGIYIFKKSDKILPGSYTIKARDAICTYYSSVIEGVTVEATKEYSINFCLEKVPPGSGQMSISGHIFLNENPDSPLSGFEVAAVNKRASGSLYYTTTNNQGEFLFNDLNCGEYNLVAVGNYADFINEIYQDVCLIDPNKFVEGKNFMAIEADSKIIFIFPGENLTGIDIGLSSYKYTFNPGLNLFGYPGLPVQKYDDSHKFCLELGNKMHNFRWKNPDTGQWYMITSNLEKSPIKLCSGQGYIIYMHEKAGPIFFPPVKTLPPQFYHLTPGKNFIAYPASLHRPIKKSSELLNAIGTQEQVANVQSYDNTSGKWKSTVWLWGKPGSSDFPIVQGEGYLVEMKVAKTVETDAPNIAP
ncbi:MAG: carboxypeptidase regulatory-like domain-containing protein [bacterium]